MELPPERADDPIEEGDSMRVAPQFAVRPRSSVESPRRVEGAVIDARPIAMRGVLIAMALMLPFWATVASLAVRLASGH
jgi:hypothetical protein